MGKTGENSWLNAVKRTFIRSPVKENEKKNCRRDEEHKLDDEEKKRGKRRWSLWKPSLLETTIQHNEAKNKASPISTSSTIHSRRANDKSEQTPAIAVAMATTAAAEAAVATTQAAVEIIRLTRPNSVLVEQQQQEAAAVVIQTTFRGYLVHNKIHLYVLSLCRSPLSESLRLLPRRARKALRALKGVVMLQSLVRGYNVRKRAKMTLQCMQSLVQVQARVCDQRRRLSCEGSQSPMLVEPITRNLSRTADDLDEKSHTVEEIQVLIQKAKEFSLKHGNTLAHALTEQIWSEDDEGLTKQCTRNNTGLCNEKDKTKSFEQEKLYFYATPPLHKNSPSPRYQRLERNYQTAETPTLRSNCFHRMSLSRSTDPTSRPNYMATTASVEARLRSQSAPRNRPSTPERDKTSSVKKRLSFPVPNIDNDIGMNSDDQKRDTPRCKNIHMVPICLEQRSYVSSYCTDSLADDVSSSTTCDTRRWLR